MKIGLIVVSQSEIISQHKNNTTSLICSALAKNGQDVAFCKVIKPQSKLVQAEFGAGFEEVDSLIVACENEFEKVYMCKMIMCEMFGCKMSSSVFAKANIDEYSRQNAIALKKDDSTYAQMPELARTIKNPKGVFQGALIENENKAFFLLPLEHSELNYMFFSSVLPYILKFQPATSKTFVLKTFGVKLGEMISLLRENIKNKHGIEVVCSEYLLAGEAVFYVPKGVRSDYANNLIMNAYSKLMPYIYSDKDESEVEFIYSILNLRHQKIAFAEDFTAGQMCSSVFSNIKDAKSILAESYIATTGESKTRLLGVDERLFKKAKIDFSEVAYQMALGVLENSGADFVVSNCGDLETGEVFFAVGNSEGVHVFSKKVEGSREQKIQIACNAIFFEMIKKIRQNDFHLGQTVV